MITIQYLNMRLDEERSSAHEYSNKTELIALWEFKETYIGKADSQTEYLDLWIWFTFTAAIFRPAG